MQIGEFAKICKTRISVLRHYDKQGLLVPAYTDRFTGYRYYTEEQINIFKQIAALKQAGFSLTEIKSILANVQSDMDILELFERKKSELLHTLQNLEDAKKMMNEIHETMKLVFEETPEGLLVTSEIGSENDFDWLCEQMDTSLISQGYQRISTYRIYPEKSVGNVRAGCIALRLKEDLSPIKENIALPFEDDPNIVGKWEIIGEYATKDDFFSKGVCRRGWWGEKIKELHFLPHGERYWCYGWTKGKILFKNGSGSSVNEYTTQEYDEKRYMFVEWKSYHYRRGGKPVILVLRQVDHTARTAKEIARRDYIDLPFVHDPRVIGVWHAYGNCRTVEEFDPERNKDEQNYFNRIEIHENGQCMCVYGGNSVPQTWTQGYIINKRSQTACGYVITNLAGKEYLFVELKNGDYIWGGMEPLQVVFVRKH